MSVGLDVQLRPLSIRSVLWFFMAARHDKEYDVKWN